MVDNTKPTLGYWKIRGLASQIRYFLAYCKVEFQEDLYEQGGAPDFSRDEWEKVEMKMGLDFPNLPYLIDGDFRFTQSEAIMRYIANKWKPEALGKDLKDKAIVDQLHGVLKDIQVYL